MREGPAPSSPRLAFALRHNHAGLKHFAVTALSAALIEGGWTKPLGDPKVVRSGVLQDVRWLHSL
jgi:hypothetical protein